MGSPTYHGYAKPIPRQRVCRQPGYRSCDVIHDHRLQTTLACGRWLLRERGDGRTENGDCEKILKIRREPVRRAHAELTLDFGMCAACNAADGRSPPRSPQRARCPRRAPLSWTVNDVDNSVHSVGLQDELTGPRTTSMRSMSSNCRSGLCHSTPEKILLQTLRPSIITSILFASRVPPPRAMIAHFFESSRATCTLGTNRSASVICETLKRINSARVKTKTAAGLSENGVDRFETVVTLRSMSSSRHRSRSSRSVSGRAVYSACTERLKIRANAKA